MNIFRPADILLPHGTNMEQWAVIACDQFSSNPAYWERVRANAADAPSAIHLILPEAELGTPDETEKIEKINETMTRYQQENVLRTLPNSMVYVERTLENGAVRRGLVGMVDLEAYDYSEGAVCAIRATEKTVVERIPPRMRVRRDAPLELPHVLLLCDDHRRVLIEPLTKEKNMLPQLYDFELMEGGGHITGWLVQGAAAEAFDERLTAYASKIDEKYRDIPGIPALFAVGDGNHSLATAKSCYEHWKAENPAAASAQYPGRYALVELENIHDEAQVFEPIHRILTGVDHRQLLEDLKTACCAQDGYAVQWYAGQEHGVVYLDRAKGQLAVGILQSFLDEWMKAHPGKIDYIHGEDDLRQLAEREAAIGFLLPAMEKSQLFRSVIADGTLPRKTFSMGHAREKRYYLEGRAIK